MKKSSFTTKGLEDHRKASGRRDTIIKGIQIATLGIVLIMVCAGVYTNIR